MMMKFLLKFNSIFSGLELLFPNRRMFLSGDTTDIPFNWKLRLLPGHFGLLIPTSKQAKNHQNPKPTNQTN